MTFDEWVKQTTETPVKTNWRLGQHWFYHLAQTHSALSQRVLDKPGVDPCYNNDNLPRFFEFVSDLWNSA